MIRFAILPLLSVLLTLFLFSDAAATQNDAVACDIPVVRRDQRTRIVETEFGDVSAVEIGNGCGVGGKHHIHFITLEPNALLLPVLLHFDMVFFVHTGSGVLAWVDEEQERKIDIRRGDIYRLHPGSVFYVLSHLERETGEKLRVYAIFPGIEDCLHDPCLAPYTSIRELVFGFGERILQSAFAVPEEIIEKIINGTKLPLIVHASPKNKTQGLEDYTWQLQWRLLKVFVGNEDGNGLVMGKSNKKKKKKKEDMETETFNIYEAEADFQNCNGRSVNVNTEHLQALEGSNIGAFMVNLTKGSMMGPHWNRWACEISIVLQGEGMIRLVRSSNKGKREEDDKCRRSMRLMVGEGDVFAVPRFLPMAEMSFNNDSFVFMGFRKSITMNYPQFLSGQRSAFKAMDREILAMAFNVSNVMIDQLLDTQKEEVILECTSCAEKVMDELKMETTGGQRKRDKQVEERERRSSFEF